MRFAVPPGGIAARFRICDEWRLAGQFASVELSADSRSNVIHDEPKTANPVHRQGATARLLARE
jgi:hypothetical protein